jgi:nickel-type superoxide dismutase maturation protease
MQPTLQPGSIVLVWRWGKHFAVGDIVAFRHHNSILIKRISSVAENGYEVRGDNTADSLDSRGFGTVEKSQLLGKIIWY